MTRDIGANHFDLGDVVGLFVPDYQKTVGDVKSGIANTSKAIERVNPAIDFISENYGKILFGVFVALVVANVFGNLIVKKY